MNQAPVPPVPRRLLLATDLSARCDRALERARQLAEEWGSELVALNVLDVAAWPDQAMAWARGGDCRELLEVARRQLARDLAGLRVRSTPRMAMPGDRADTIAEVARHSACELVIAGMSHQEASGRFGTGSTLKRLANTLPMPLLVIRHRPLGPYRHIVVALDPRAASRHLLHTAARLFPGRRITTYHARPEHAAAAAEPAAAPGEDALPAAAALQHVSEAGALESTLTRYVRSHDVDLAVIGIHRRHWSMDMLLGNTATRMLDWLPCDVLLVRLPDGEGSAGAAGVAP